MPSKPNIVVILADDMGYSDIGCFGSEIATPNLDTLAAEGVRFTQMYNGARCCPTRATLLTGLYAQQAGVGHMIGDCGVGPAYQGYLRDDCVTIGEVLSSHGYRTCYSGKWHTSPGLPVKGEPEYEPGHPRNPYPRTRGFERFYGTLAGGGGYFYPLALMEQDTRIEPDAEGYYYTDAVSDKAVAMIDESATDGRPFFLHVCYTAPHWPLHALEEDIERYRGRYSEGWDAVRTARHETLKGMGILDSAWPISPRDPNSHDFFDEDDKRRHWNDLRMAVYAAQIDRMDQGIGRILEALRRHGMDENTMVMFLSDNGGCAEFLNEDGDENRWPGKYALTTPPGVTCHVGNTERLDPGGPDTFMSYELPWANASNSPFRLYKHWVHEGGIGTPFVVRWPKGMRSEGSDADESKATAGSIRHRPCHIVDIMPTCVEAAGATYPSEYNGHPIPPMEGESFLPLLRGEAKERERPLFWEHEGNRAVRDGRWKLVSKHPGRWELYDMVTDRTELNDLADRNKPVRDRLAGMYNEWAERCGVLPWPLTPGQ